MGEGALICFPPGDNVGQEHIAIGAATLVAPNVTMSVGMAPGQPLAPGTTSPVLRIGDRCLIGRGSHLVAHRSLAIGDDVIRSEEHTSELQSLMRISYAV